MEQNLLARKDIRCILNGKDKNFFFSKSLTVVNDNFSLKDKGKNLTINKKDIFLVNSNKIELTKKIQIFKKKSVNKKIKVRYICNKESLFFLR